MTDALQVVTAEGVCRVTFHRPETLNALDEEMATGLVAALSDATADEGVRAVLLTGAGTAFSSGAALAGDDPVRHFDERTLEGAAAMTRSIVACDKPVVARVNGLAVGVAAALCLAADLAVTAASAAFLLPFTRLGLMPDGGSSLTAAASMGRARAMRAFLLGEPVPAEEAYAAGLVSHVVPDDALDEEVERILRRLVRGPALSYAATKKAVNAATLARLEEVLEREGRGQVVLFGTEDAAEGLRAVVAGRRPAFVGR